MKLAIDIGSNTSKCLLATFSKGELEKVFEKSLECRISAGTNKLVDSAGEMIVQAIDNFLAQTRTFTDKFDCIAVATSALRDSPQRDSIVDYVHRQTGVHIKILSGDDEARLSFLGACSDAQLPVQSNCAYFDLGGGSLEVAFGRDKQLISAQSFKIGAVVLTRMFCVSSEYVSSSEIKSIGNYVEGVLSDMSALPLNILIGAGGAVVAARMLNEKINSVVSNKISVSQIRRFIEILAPMSVQERSDTFGIAKTRADILVPAFICIAKLAQKLGVEEIYHTFNNLRYGVLLDSFKEQNQSL